MSSSREPVTITLQPWFKDHCFGGKIVLAAVETMTLLASEAKKHHPGLNIRVMENVRFAKFLEIPQQAGTMNALFEYESISENQVRVKLLSQIQVKTMKRVKEHGEIVFSTVNNTSHHAPDLDSTRPPGPLKEFTAEHIYRELVPFGPHYHTLQETLYLSEQGAWGKVKAPELPFTHAIQNILESPFPLDGALHAACVLGQQSVDFIPFPVGFDRRIISRPTQPGSSYITKVVPVSQTQDELIFDLDIFDTAGRIFESVTGVRMRVVGGIVRR